MGDAQNAPTDVDVHHWTGCSIFMGCQMNCQMNCQIGDLLKPEYIFLSWFSWKNKVKHIIVLPLILHFPCGDPKAFLKSNSNFGVLQQQRDYFLYSLYFCSWYIHSIFYPFLISTL